MHYTSGAIYIASICCICTRAIFVNEICLNTILELFCFVFFFRIRQNGLSSRVSLIDVSCQYCKIHTILL